MPRKYLIIPSQLPKCRLNGLSFWNEYRTYSEYNYLSPGIVSTLKRWHFEIALSLTSDKFHKSNVIDFGCADGFFLPSLACYFPYVVGIDQQPSFINIAHDWLEYLDINNVNLICNHGLAQQELIRELPNRTFEILYLLDVLEHVGDRVHPKSSNNVRVKFLKDLFELISDDGIIVISVPKMVGISFLLQRTGLAFFRMNREYISIIDLIKSVIRKDTSKLENQWTGGHIGFNDIEFESVLKDEFSVLAKKENLCHSVLCLAKK